MASQNGAKVDSGVMRQGASVITSTGDGITRVNGQVDSTMHSLRATWQSDAALVFDQAMASFDQTVKTIVQRLTTLSEHVTQGAAEYDSRDEDNTSQAKAQAAVIGGGGLAGF
ncbi:MULTISPECIES: WXG100 family type VII secretion target [Amycolatopsis]|jgi:ESAT-6 family protein|uniref:WXG100 family type VII secretion target n=1 Tax=Amycolatopsis saalfeldensis TaxID=394193 RepID=A0A1H8YJJ3_9PSEU|nr:MULTISPECIES: WXG100 family type VII secretion target [Amycolatopsis]SEP52326.1 WXG100 family type VII secretion target [Amycolatopsis saalfeldensis]